MANGDDKDLDLAKWLVKMLSRNCCPGLELMPEGAGKFKIPWLNEKSGGLRPGNPDTLFIKAWAKHKNYPHKYGGLNKDLIEWKSKFRNSLNSCVKQRKTIKKLKDETIQGHIVCQFEDSYYRNSSNDGCFSVNADYPPGLGLHFTSGAEDELCNHSDIQDNLLKAYPERVTVDVCNYDFPDQNIESNIQRDNLATGNVSRTNSTVASNISVFPMAASPDVEPVLDISISYGIPRILVQNFILKSDKPACRLHYPSLANSGVQSYLDSEKNLMPLQMPALNDMHEINHAQKRTVMKILTNMDRGLNLRYVSGNVFAERRAMIKILVSSDMLQSYELPRRKTRNDPPEEVLVFDYQEYQRRLSQFQEHLLTTPPKHVIIFSFPASTLPNDGRCLTPVEITVTHTQALKQCDAFLAQQEPSSLVKTSEEDTLDQLLEKLDTIGSDERELSVEYGDAALLSAIDQVLEMPEANITERACAMEQIVVPMVAENPVMIITVYCGRPYHVLDKRYVSMSQSLCRIFSGTSEFQMNCDNFNDACDVSLSLPSEVDPLLYSDAEKINKILSKLRRGVHVKYVDGDIYVERRCFAEVYLTDGVEESQRLPRRKLHDQSSNFIKVFDYSQFKKCLESYKLCPIGRLPAFEFKLTIGSQIHPERSNAMMNILLHTSICHFPALQEIYQTFGNPVEHFDPMISVPDSIDRILQFVKAFEHNNEMT